MVQSSDGNSEKWSSSELGLKLEAGASGDEVKIVLDGEVDIYTQPVLRAAVQTALDLGLPLLVIDMSDVPHLDSGGMAILISAKKKLMARGGEISLVSVNPHIYRTLEITGLVDFLNASPASDEKSD